MIGLNRVDEEYTLIYSWKLNLEDGKLYDTDGGWITYTRMSRPHTVELHVSCGEISF